MNTFKNDEEPVDAAAVSIISTLIPSYGGTGESPVAGTEPETVTIDETFPVAEEVVPLVAPLSNRGPGAVASDAYEGDGREGAVCRDGAFAILFYIHLGLMLWVGIDVAPKGFDKIDVNFDGIENEIRKGNDVTEEQIQQMKEFIAEVGKFLTIYPKRIFTLLVIPSAFLSFIVAFLITVLIIKPFPRMMVYGCLIESLALMAGLLIYLCVVSRAFMVYVITCLSLLSIMYYISIAWKMVPFAAANLKVALEGCSRNCGIYIVAFVFAKMGVVWVIYWCFTVVGFFSYQVHTCQANHPDADFDMASDNYDNECDPSGFLILMFILSLYWTTTITMNMIQVTVAGVVATWCFAKDEANNCCSLAVFHSLYRSLTYSFGSVCFGSLLQALVSLFRYVVEQARNQRDRNDNCDGCGSIFLCILECIASLLEDIIYIFNQYTYIYAGIYGLSYLDSGRKVMDLFRARGWTTIISNNLVGYVLSYTAFSVGILSGFIALLVERIASQQLQGSDVEGDDRTYDSLLFGPIPGWKFWTFGIGTILGFWVAGVMMNVVKGGVNTIIVCWADSPNVFEMNHPSLTREMADSWTSVFPEIDARTRPVYTSNVSV